jgi:hypothetical protein
MTLRRWTQNGAAEPPKPPREKNEKQAMRTTIFMEYFAIRVIHTKTPKK